MIYLKLFCFIGFWLEPSQSRFTVPYLNAVIEYG